MCASGISGTSEPVSISLTKRRAWEWPYWAKGKNYNQYRSFAVSVVGPPPSPPYTLALTLLRPDYTSWDQRQIAFRSAVECIKRSCAASVTKNIPYIVTQCILIRGKYFSHGPQIKLIPPLKISILRIIGDTNYLGHNGSTVDVNVADRAHSTCYISRLKLRSLWARIQKATRRMWDRGRYTRHRCQEWRARHSFGVTCCYAPSPHCTQSRTAHDIHQNREQRFPTRPHPTVHGMRVWSIRDRGDDKKDEIANYLNILVLYRELCWAPKMSTTNY